MSVNQYRGQLGPEDDGTDFPALREILDILRNGTPERKTEMREGVRQAWPRWVEAWRHE